MQEKESIMAKPRDAKRIFLSAPHTHERFL